MNRYLKLVHWEITRFWKMLMIMALVTIVMQCAGVIYVTKRHISQVNESIQMNNSTIAAYVQHYGKLSFIEGIEQAGLAIYASITVCIGVLILYVFFIWYKEWLGKNTFIYRLLTLPTARRNIYFAKLTAILLFIFALVALQIVLVPLENGLYMLAGGNTLFASSGMFELISSNRLLHILIPQTFTDFVVNYGTGAIFVLIIFTGVLLERSYRLKGIAAAVLFIVTACLFMILPLVLLTRMAENLYQNEIFFIEAALGLIVAAVTIWLGLHLITKKVTV
ncbi:hypothetical protein [Paenibacillus sp. R14(2021)]|uniref:hypothetical protein n=1 Tax=Paenibacillus sp. R14(2021) TaxID=2859228 RepID=UPI001C6149D8|nr:hypothetical protein [Paenibacillus sp. R14(2021)]